MKSMASAPQSLRCIGTLVFWTCFLAVLVDAWEWSDFVRGGHGANTGAATTTTAATSMSTPATLSMQEVSDMRVRDIKRRLTRNHGYSAEEVARILDKKELVQALAFEEEKLRLQGEEQAKRTLIQQGILAAIVSIFVVLCWPLFQHAYEVALVNLVVYTDRKKHEASRCYALQSTWGLIGVLLMGILDVLQVWLTASVILSWVMSSKYFFPVPSLTVRPGQFMGQAVAQSPMANYGINIGSMLLTYGMRFMYRRIEQWTGRVLSTAHRQQRREERHAERQSESAEDAATRREARKAARLQKQYQQQQQQQYQAANMYRSSAQRAPPPPPPPPDWEQHLGSNNGMASRIPVNSSKAHHDFLNQLDKQPIGEETEDHGLSKDALDDDEPVVTTALDELD